MPTLRVRVTVRAGARSRGIEQMPDGSLRIKTTVAPEKGRANEDVVDMLADHYKVGKSCVRLVRGASSRRKEFEITAP
jgi:uncharacterized protein YggU (UPF0235/DUF167 family)